MEATIRKEDNNQVTLILDGRLDTSVTQQTEKEVEPLYDFKADDGIQHTVWKIADSSACAADELQELFANIPAAYIADILHIFHLLIFKTYIKYYTMLS